jgi:uncharacterized protein (TIGR00106 family)
MPNENAALKSVQPLAPQKNASRRAMSLSVLHDTQPKREAARREALRTQPSPRSSMKVMLDFCVVPIGVGVSVSRYVAECQRVLEARGLSHRMHPYGTVVEGEWEAVFDALKTCHERVHELGAPRISTSIRLGTRTDREQTMDDKLASVQRKLAEP